VIPGALIALVPAGVVLYRGTLAAAVVAFEFITVVATSYQPADE
jgi:hypothetical protein